MGRLIVTRRPFAGTMSRTSTQRWDRKVPNPASSQTEPSSSETSPNDDQPETAEQMFARIVLMQFDADDRATGDLIDGNPTEPDGSPSIT